MASRSEGCSALPAPSKLPAGCSAPAAERALRHCPAPCTPPPCSDELAEKLRLLESKLLHGEAHGGLDKLAQEKEAQVRQQQLELRRQKEQVRWWVALARAAALALSAARQMMQESTEGVGCHKKGRLRCFSHSGPGSPPTQLPAPPSLPARRRPRRRSASPSWRLRRRAWSASTTRCRWVGGWACGGLWWSAGRSLVGMGSKRLCRAADGSTATQAGEAAVSPAPCPTPVGPARCGAGGGGCQDGGAP